MRVHQNIILGGKDIGDNPRRLGSKFYNEGKWDNFINRLLPTDCSGMTFVEIGCNAGLYLKLAKQRGFKNVVGVDNVKNNCVMAEKYRDSLKLDYKIIHDSVGEDFDTNKIPVADFVLLSNLHYHLKLTDFLLFLDRLRFKTRNCIVVSVNDRKDIHWQPHSDIKNTRSYFEDWKEIKTIEDVPRDDHRNRKMWSGLFKSKLERVDILRINNPKTIDFSLVGELVNLVINKKEEDVEKTKYFKYVKKIRTKEWPYDRIIDFINEKITLIKNIKENGQINPILVSKDYRILDGGHRLSTLKALGHKSVITRII